MTRESTVELQPTQIPTEDVVRDDHLKRLVRLYPDVTDETAAPDAVQYCSNKVITSRYTALNFVPLNLWEQFQEKSRMYFLLIGVLQCIPSVSTTMGIPTMYLPLSFILFVSALRAALEDKQRHKADEEASNRGYPKYTASGFQTRTSGDLVVGDIVRIDESDTVPADLLIIKSSNTKGHLFVETASLDGETSLKIRRAVPELQELLQEDKHIMTEYGGTLKYELPNANFDSFKGSLCLKDRTYASVDGSMLLLRDTTLKNTEYVYGLVVYTGEESKIRQNVAEDNLKTIPKSDLMSRVDDFLVLMFAIQAILCTSAALIEMTFNLNDAEDHWYLAIDADGATGVHTLERIFTWWIIMAQLVPISLVVSMEVVKTAQAAFIGFDVSIYDKKIEKATSVQTSSLNEELGQVQYIFSDKTGTLTQNCMEFRVGFVGMRQFGSSETEISRRVKLQRRLGRQMARSPHPERVKERYRRKWSTNIRVLEQETAKREADVGGIPFVHFDGAYREEMQQILKKGDAESDAMHWYLVHMAISNTITTAETKDPSSGEVTIDYQSSSPDELALCSFAKYMGYEFIQRNPTVIRRSVPGMEPASFSFRHIASLDFNSKRKRLTMVYEKDDRIYVMCKGADSEIWPLCGESGRQVEPLFAPRTCEMAENGLRTLIVAHAEVDATWWDKWSNRWEFASSLPEVDQEAGHTKGGCSEDCRICECMRLMEESAGLEFLGATAIEDRLQDLVPESIDDFLRGGMRVWMLTGDKRETAKNIAIACNLVDPDMETSSIMIGENESSRLIQIVGEWAKLVNDKNQLRHMFRRWDLSADGLLQRDEMRVLCTSLGIVKDSDEAKFEAAFDKADLDQNNEIDFDEFVLFMRSLDLSIHHVVGQELQHGVQLLQAIEDTDGGLDTAPVSMVIEGSALKTLYASLELRELFFDIASKCKSVVCCRMTPAQKALIVKEMKHRHKAVCLAVGDGANDEQMIIEANVGVGIAGVEGTAAVRASDYAIGQFRFLHTLLFVHGIWSYDRISSMTHLIFYKTALLSFCMYTFGFFSVYSGQQFFHDSILLFYNVAFTVLPVLVIGIWGQTLDRKTLEDYPEAYKAFSQGALLNWSTFLSWMGSAAWHSVLIVLLIGFTVGDDTVARSDGQTSDLWVFSLLVYTAVVVLATFRVYMEMRCITWLHWFSIAFSFLIYFPLVFIVTLSNDLNPLMYGVFVQAMSSLSSWLAVLIASSIPLLVASMSTALFFLYKPTLIDVLREYAQSPASKIEEVIDELPEDSEEEEPVDERRGSDAMVMKDVTRQLSMPLQYSSIEMSTEFYRQEKQRMKLNTGSVLSATGGFSKYLDTDTFSRRQSKA